MGEDFACIAFGVGVCLCVGRFALLGMDGKWVGMVRGVEGDKRYEMSLIVEVN